METEVGMKYLFCSSFRLDWLVWANIILIANPGDGFSIFSICAGLMNSVHLQLFDLFCHWNIRVCACVFLWFFLYADNFRNCEFFQKFSLSALVKSFRTMFVAIWSRLSCLVVEDLSVSTHTARSRNLWKQEHKVCSSRWWRLIRVRAFCWPISTPQGVYTSMLLDDVVNDAIDDDEPISQIKNFSGECQQEPCWGNI